LTDDPQVEREAEIAQMRFRGRPLMKEVVFLYKPSRTLILTDSIENVDPRTLNWWQTRLARFAGILSP
jgi:hypothetical protein